MGSLDAVRSTRLSLSMPHLKARFKGTPKDVAMRRYITLLRSLDESLVVIKDQTTNPHGFPLTAQGAPNNPFSFTSSFISQARRSVLGATAWLAARMS